MPGGLTLGVAMHLIVSILCYSIFCYGLMFAFVVLDLFIFHY